jgi:hypothetical protein
MRVESGCGRNRNFTLRDGEPVERTGRMIAHADLLRECIAWDSRLDFLYAICIRV